MKYQYQPIEASKKEREEVNKKILSILKNHDDYGISKEDIFNGYTGKGGLHGLSPEDYKNYSKFSGAKKELEEGQFFTPDPIIKSISDLINPTCSDLVADLTCGIGGFANHAPEESNFYGCELDRNAVKVAKSLFPMARIEQNDIRFYDPGVKFDVIYGNPPFNLDFDGVNSQFYYFEKAADLLVNGGFVAVVVPLSFLMDLFQDKNKIAEIEESFNFIGQCELPANTFKANVKTKFMVWQKKAESITFNVPYKPILVSYEDLTVYVNEAKSLKEKNRHRLNLENIRNTYIRSFSYAGKTYKESLADFEFKLYKYLNNVKYQKPEKYNACLDYLREFENQKVPDGMSKEELERWNQYNKITPAKVIAYIKAFLRPHKEKKAPNIISDKKLSKRYRFDALQQTPNSGLPADPDITSYLDVFTFFDMATQKWVNLNDMQKSDMNIAAQKDYFYLQWEQGAGKTAAGFAWALYKKKKYNLENVFVVAPAIAIKNTWADFLKFNNQSWVSISSLSDLPKIKKGDFVILSFEKLNQIKVVLKKWLKLRSHKIAFILDEADNISNPSTNRSKAVLSVFQSSKCKIAMSGTMTRNNITESFTQFYLLYGSTSNFLCSCSEVYYESKDGDTSEIYDEINHYYNEPFPAYRKGYSLFQSCFNPVKTTVFGIKKTDQNVYNAEELKRLIDYSVITRRFEEIRGEKLYSIHQEHCGFNRAEVSLYKKIINEFDRLRDNYFKSTGDSRKDSLLKIIQQINLLLKACSIPHKFLEYKGKSDSSKMVKIMDMIKDMDKVAIGCTRVETVTEYEKMIKKIYPDRRLFIITGNRTTISQRKKIAEEMKKYSKVILVATQPALSCSMSIDSIDHVILPEMDWNNSRMAQFYFRFIRYSSTREKNVYFVTYENSLEANLLQLIINKDKLNLFMKNQDLNMSELYDKFGVDGNLLDFVLSRDYDPESESMKIRWSESSIRASSGRKLERLPAETSGNYGYAPEQIQVFEKGLLFEY